MYDAETTGQTHPDSLRVVGYHFRDEFLMIKHYTNLCLLNFRGPCFFCIENDQKDEDYRPEG